MEDDAPRPAIDPTYDSSDEHPEDWQARAHCDLARHRRMTALRAKATV
jgi:hypothetical protein